jgi:serine/threonine-protein kinase RsbW
MAESFTIAVVRDIEILTSLRMEISLRLETVGVDEDTVAQVELCTYELLVNLIEHSTINATNPIDLYCTIYDEKVEVKFNYECDGFDPTSHGDIDLADHFNAGKKRGLGLYILHTLMDELIFDHDSGNCTLVMTKYV